MGRNGKSGERGRIAGVAGSEGREEGIGGVGHEVDGTIGEEEVRAAGVKRPEMKEVAIVGQASRSEAMGAGIAGGVAGVDVAFSDPEVEIG